jgi:ABC-type Fe3+/spermidine/putrescine transport system ATPase subunit
LEKGQSNLKYLKPFYEYAYKRFGTNLSSDNELLMEDADQKLKRKMKDELESEVKKEEHISGPKFDEVTTDSNEKIKMNLQKAKENKTNSDESARMLLQE